MILHQNKYPDASVENLLLLCEQVLHENLNFLLVLSLRFLG